MGYLSNQSFYEDPELQYANQAPPAVAPTADATEPLKAGAAGGMAGGPAGALIGVGGSFLTQYLAQRAAEEAQRKQNIQQATSQHTQNERGQINDIMNAYNSLLFRK